ncbi:unnamed protein product [Ilex paraguariensis]|uniref:S phase cyclin A-associated protein in the endoplasmic reticulum N-terminal domain-containing protein n=1 Tax=Ilex paraguariensis TaxID=185542 RepID=A0ABC8UDJ4_9AQUA
MESCEGVDDPTSGWLQVKKKHRNSSKFSFHGWVGGFSGKQSPNIQHCQPSLNVRSGNSHVKCGRQPPKASGDFVVQSLGRVSNSSSVSTEDRMDVQYLDKCVVSQDDECPSSPLSVAVNVKDADSRTGDHEEYPQIKNPDVLSKIKLGDLDGGALVLHGGSTVGAKIKFGGFEVDNLFCGKADNSGTSISCMSSCIEPQELQATSAEADLVPQRAHNESFEENCKEVTAVSSEDVEVQITNENIVDPSGNTSSCGKTHPEPLEAVNDDAWGASSQSGENIIYTAIEEAGMVELPAPAVISKAGDVVISELPSMNGGSSTGVISQDSEVLLPEKSRTETLGESTMTSSVEYCEDQKTHTIIDTISKAQIMSAIGADDMGESKERFRQRLWCFLFENLNRAIDELYLLCELECDLEQTKEAILVLEEAASDFKELNSRVEEFEKVKRSSSQLIDGPPTTLKSEHRRPHALSWEVSLLASFIKPI